MERSKGKSEYPDSPRMLRTDMLGLDDLARGHVACEVK